MKHITISIIICAAAITQSLFTQASFSSKTDFTTGSTPLSVAMGDFNGDGKLDMAVANQMSNTVSVLLNTTPPGATTPSFSAKTDFTTGSEPRSVSLGDFNGDGKLDIAVVNQASYTVSVFLNTTAPGATTPSFSTKTDFAVGLNFEPYSVATGDLNGDGKLDMAVANYDSSTVSVFFNTTIPGVTTPSFSTKTDFATGGKPMSVAIGDFNGDGENDIVVTNFNSNSVSVFLNITAPGATTPSFSAKTDFTTGIEPRSVTLGDFNGDGKLDMAVAINFIGTVSVFLNTTIPGATSPSFSAKTDFATGTEAISVAIVDFNGDGKLDMAVANLMSNTVSVFLNTTIPGAPTPSFSAKIDFATGTEATSVAGGDLNGDGENDIAVTNANAVDNSVSVFLNTTVTGVTIPSFASKTDFITGDQPRSICIGDFNGDGKNDVAVVNNSSNTVSVFLNTTAPGATTPSFSAKTDFTTGSYPNSVSIGDFNGDGKLDMAVVNSGSNTISVFLNTTAPGATTPSFSAKNDFATGTDPCSVSIGDFNGDGKNDMAMANYASTTVSVLLNTTAPGATTPSFSTKTDFTTGGGSVSGSIGDFNGDGKNDMAVANYTSNTVSVFLNTTVPGATTPSFSSKTDFSTGSCPSSVSIGDFNGDGKNDLAVANYSSTTVSVFLNTTAPGATTPSFSDKTDFVTGTDPCSVSIGDFNGDGKNDIAVANFGSTVSVFLNTTAPGATTPSFSSKTDFTTGSTPLSVAMGDFNGDGKLDMAVANQMSNTVSVLLNTTPPGATTPSFSAKTDFTTGSEPRSVSLGDFNGDGKLDIAVGNYISSTVSILLNNVVVLPLPVELTSITANVSGSSVYLHWRTATEVNNYGFEVERRVVENEQSTVNNWKKVGFVQGAGTSNTPKEYSYSDAIDSPGSYVYHLKQIDTDGSFKYSQSAEVKTQVPEHFELAQNYPNPFNPGTTFHIALPITGDVKLVVLNVLGQEVAEVVNKHLEEGTYNFSWIAKNLSSGIYFFKMTANHFWAIRKMTLMK